MVSLSTSLKYASSVISLILKIRSAIIAEAATTKKTRMIMITFSILAVFSAS